MAIHCYTWVYMQYIVIHGNTRLHIGIHGYTWFYMAIHGITWVYMALHGSTWVYIAIFIHFLIHFNNPT